ncbi:MAG TPA: dienelactone hydrolase family protein [Polyangiaceae bacterium]|jgi:poly(3-hydroxybutyrate) depolymerase
MAWRQAMGVVAVGLLAGCSSGSEGGHGFATDGGGALQGEAGAEGASPSGPDGGAGATDAASDASGQTGPGDSAAPDVAPVEASSAALSPGTSTLSLTIAGVARSVLLHVPAHAGPMPLVIALHGDGDTSTNFVSYEGLTGDADADGFVLAAPQGITREVTIHESGQAVQTIPGIDWDPYNSIASDGSIVSDDNEDVPLLDAIRTQLVASGSIDPHHVVVYGYSQGGYLAFRYGMSAGASVACAAVVSAATPLPGTTLIEKAPRKTPVFLQIGTADGAYAAAQQTEQELTQNGNPVQWVAVEGAGHVPPPGDPKAPLAWCLQQALP